MVTARVSDARAALAPPRRLRELDRLRHRLRAAVHQRGEPHHDRLLDQALEKRRVRRVAFARRRPRRRPRRLRRLALESRRHRRIQPRRHRPRGAALDEGGRAETSHPRGAAERRSGDVGWVVSVGVGVGAPRVTGGDRRGVRVRGDGSRPGAVGGGEIVVGTPGATRKCSSRGTAARRAAPCVPRLFCGRLEPRAADAGRGARRRLGARRRRRRRRGRLSAGEDDVADGPRGVARGVPGARAAGAGAGAGAGGRAAPAPYVACLYLSAAAPPPLPPGPRRRSGRASALAFPPATRDARAGPSASAPSVPPTPSRRVRSRATATRGRPREGGRRRSSPSRM